MDVVLISIWLAIVGLMTFGLPGAAVLQAATILERLFSHAELGSDQVDVAEIAISVFGPLALLPAYLVVRRTRLPPWTRALITMTLAFAVTLVISATGIIISGR